MWHSSQVVLAIVFLSLFPQSSIAVSPDAFSGLIDEVSQHIDPEQHDQGRDVQIWADYLSRPHPDVATLREFFAEAASEFQVPQPLLEAIAKVETNWLHIGPSIDRGWGIMHLVENNYSHTLTESAELLGLDPQILKDDPRQNIRGAAALLAKYAGQDCYELNLADWFSAAARFSGLISEDLQRMQAQLYLDTVKHGSRSNTAWKELLILEPFPEIELRKADRSERSTDYPPANENLTPCNHWDGRDHSIDTWVNHWIGVGTYAGTISHFHNCGSEVSAHFVIRCSDGEITQVVRVADTAWHCGAYGFPFNNSRSIGVEHEATISNPDQWNSEPMLLASTQMANYFCQLYNIPMVRALPGIRGHNEMPGCNTTCPGNLPWDLWMDWLNGVEISCSFSVYADGSGPFSLAGWKFWRGVSGFYQVTGNVYNLPAGWHYSVWLVSPTAVFYGPTVNNSGSSSFSFGFDAPPGALGGGGYSFYVSPQGDSGNPWCQSDTFYLGDLPDLEVSISPNPMIIEESSTVTWSVTGGIPGLPDGGWTGDIRLQWYQFDNDLANLAQIPVADGTYTFITPASVPDGSIPGCSFQIAGVNAETGTSIPGGYVYDFSPEFCIEGSPLCEVAPNSLSFNVGTIGQSQERTFTIKNVGCGTLSGNVSESCGDFTRSPSSYSLGPNQTQTFTVTYTPNDCGNDNCTIDTGTPCASDGDVTCTATGPSQPICDIDPGSLEFYVEDPHTGETDTQSFTVTNIGCGQLIVSEITVTSVDAEAELGSFSFNPYSFNLFEDDSQTVEVIWNPESYGDPVPYTFHLGEDCDPLVVQVDSATPVLVSEFNLRVDPGKVTVHCEIAEWDSTSDFRIMASNGPEMWNVPCEFNESTREIDASDNSELVKKGGVIVYRLEMQESGHGWLILREETVEVDAMPMKTALLGAYPNPFNPSVAIKFSVAVEGACKLKIVDIVGREISVLTAKHYATGDHLASWTGLDKSGADVPSGIYFAVLMTKGGVDSIKLVLLR